MRRIAFGVACGIVAICLCGITGPALGASPLRVTDALGREVEIHRPVHRIVALNSDVLEVIRTLKALDLVVGVYSEIVREPAFWGALVKKPAVGSWRDPDMEAISALNPDLVIAYSRNPSPLLEEKMALFGISVLRLDFYKIETLEREVETLGRLLNREEDAMRFCAWHRRQLAMIRGKIAETPERPRVYIESYTDYHTTGPGSGAHEMCVMAGGTNVAATLSIPYPLVTPEWVVSENPEVIVKAAAYGNGFALTDATPFDLRRDAILQRSVWRHIAAVETGNVHVMDSAVWTGPRAIIGIAYLARWIHPALFADLDPEALHREYLKTFQEVDYRGVFVSDPLRKAGK